VRRKIVQFLKFKVSYSTTCDYHPRVSYMMMDLIVAKPPAEC